MRCVVLDYAYPQAEGNIPDSNDSEE